MFTAPSPAAPVPNGWRAVGARGVLVLLALCAGAAGAQQPLYRVVGPDGRVTFTDRPPTAANDLRPVTPVPPSGPATGGLPSDLAALVGRFPVQLYTGPNCASCEEARSLLRRRGVPYLERTVSTARDVAELERLTGDRVLPSMTVGRQAVVGLRASEWGGWLDAAGYPPMSRLPAGWRPADPLPLAATPAATRGPAEAPPAAPPPPPATTPGPGGIRF